MSASTHILLIEDDPAVASSLQAGLRREGYQVTWKASGEDGLAAARKTNPHLIILDVRLPDMSGFDVCRRLRAAKLHQPVLFLTVQGEEVDKVLGLEMGADDYMTKPYSLRELLSRLRALLRRAYGEFAAPNADLLYTRDIQIDRSQGQAFRDGHSLNLTPTEFRLLAYLAQHAGQVFSRSQLLEAVWGLEAGLMDERVINVHIRRLREKIELNPAQPDLVLTVPGLGYRLAS